MGDEVLSSVGAQDMDTSRYHVSADLYDVEFYKKDDQLDVVTVFKPSIEAPFSPTAFDDLEMGDSAVNPILLDEEDSPPTTPVSERSTRAPALLSSRPLGTRKEHFTD